MEPKQPSSKKEFRNTILVLLIPICLGTGALFALGYILSGTHIYSAYLTDGYWLVTYANGSQEVCDSCEVKHGQTIFKGCIPKPSNTNR